MFIIILLSIMLLFFQNCGCCPQEYTQCAAEGGICNGSGVIAYGYSTRYTYKESSGSINCSNTTFGDPFVGIGKECCSQTSPLTGDTKYSPIVGTISCGETKYSYFKNNDDIHYWQFATTNIRDVTYSTCEHAYVYTADYRNISIPYCDDCNEDQCNLAIDNALFTITLQLPGTHYIAMRPFSVGGDYQLGISCTAPSKKKRGMLTLSPSNSPTTSASDNEAVLTELLMAAIGILSTVIALLIVFAFKECYYCYKKKQGQTPNSNDDEGKNPINIDIERCDDVPKCDNDDINDCQKEKKLDGADKSEESIHLETGKTLVNNKHIQSFSEPNIKTKAVKVPSSSKQSGDKNKNKNGTAKSIDLCLAHLEDEESTTKSE